MTRSASSSTIGADERRQAGRIVAEVGVHLDDGRRSAGERHAEAVEVGPAETLLQPAVADPDAQIDRRQRVGQVPGPVGRIVVDHEQRRRRQGGQDGRRDRLDVVGFVVRRQDDPDAGARRARSGCGVSDGGSVIEPSLDAAEPRMRCATAATLSCAPVTATASRRRELVSDADPTRGGHDGLVGAGRRHGTRSRSGRPRSSRTTRRRSPGCRPGGRASCPGRWTR